MSSFTLASIINSRRVNVGLTQEELAEKVGTVRTTVTKWENGTREPSWSNFVKLCEVLSLEVNDFLEKEEI